MSLEDDFEFFIMILRDILKGKLRLSVDAKVKPLPLRLIRANVKKWVVNNVACVS